MSEAASNKLDTAEVACSSLRCCVRVFGNSYFRDQSLLVSGDRHFWWSRYWLHSVTTEQGCGFSGHWSKASRTEIRKVVWPTRQETRQTTLIVWSLWCLWLDSLGLRQLPGLARFADYWVKGRKRWLYVGT